MDNMPGRQRPPTIRGRRLAAELTELRDRAGLTREQVEAETGVAIGTLFRIEKAQSRPQRRTLLTLLDLYGVKDPAARETLVALSRQSNQLGWLEPFEDALTEKTPTFISFESEATQLTMYEQSFVPGLLQTPQYARALIGGINPALPTSDIDQRVEVRLRRQELLANDKPVALWVVLDEAVTRRVVGGPAVMKAQLDRLAEAAERPNVTLQVIPDSAGAHPGMRGAFALMDFEAPDPPVVYLDTLVGELFFEKDADVQRYRTMHRQLIAQALSPAESGRLIKQAATAS
jgi:transcriptional regulator with XRE-family HTH domain